MIDGIKFDMSLRESGTSGTSEKWRERAEQFLDEIDVFTPKIGKQTMEIISSLSDIRLPEKNEQMRIRTQTQLNMISIIVKIVLEKEKIDELTISTYTLNKEAFAVLENLVNSGRVKKLNLLISSSYNFREPDWSKEIRKRSIKMGISLVFAWFHFKIALARCGTDFFQIEGSMNFSTNNMAEQLVFENNEEVYDHDYNLLTVITTERKTKAVERVC